MLDCVESVQDSYWSEVFGYADVVAQPSGRWRCAQTQVNHESMEVEKLFGVAAPGSQSLLRTPAFRLERVEIVRAIHSRRCHDCLIPKMIQ